MNATWTTISGRTQCARIRGNPVAFVNGDAGSSIESSRFADQQESGVETGADPSGKDEIAVLVVADEQGTKADARTLWIGEPADDELLGGFTLHLQPVLRTPMFVR